MSVSTEGRFLPFPWYIFAPTRWIAETLHPSAPAPLLPYILCLSTEAQNGSSSPCGDRGEGQLWEETRLQAALICNNLSFICYQMLSGDTAVVFLLRGLGWSSSRMKCTFALKEVANFEQNVWPQPATARWNSCNSSSRQLPVVLCNRDQEESLLDGDAWSSLEWEFKMWRINWKS